MAKNGAPHGTVIIAQSQNAGRGRFNRQFFSPANTGLYISFVLDAKDMGISDVGLLTPLAAVVTARVIDEITSKKCGIKWVNDLYFEDKKVCGILTEGVIDKNGLQRFVLGIGINIVASGGVSSIKDVKKLRKLDVYGAIIGKAYYTGAISLEEAIREAK
jgi:BirA family biotin operon repressor/biotin-[acetyl-CoA-carboxylase] ligase